MVMCYPSSADWACVGTPEDLAELDPAIKERAEKLAWASLARLTGFRLSLCPTVLRPCRVRCAPRGWAAATVSGFGDGYSPYIENGIWYNACGCQADECGCGVIRELVLPDQEVSGPIVVKIDGATLDPSAYRIDNGNRLVRQDGQDWPMCQDMNTPILAPPVVAPVTLTWASGANIAFSREGDVVTAVITSSAATTSGFMDVPSQFEPAGDSSVAVDSPDSDVRTTIASNASWQRFFPGVAATYSIQYLADPLPMVPQTGTFTISYYVGVGPDDLLNYAAGILAGEWYKACIGQDCRLPSTATKVTRQGVDFTIPSFDSGTSGIREVDNIVAIYNPHHVKTPSRVISVDSMRGRKRTA